MAPNARKTQALTKLVVKTTVGIESPEKLSQSFTVASTAALSGFNVSIWLTGEATWLALPGRADEFSLESASSLSEMIKVLLENGKVTVCSQCAARRSLSETDLLPGITIRGAASFVEEIMDRDTRALIY